MKPIQVVLPKKPWEKALRHSLSFSSYPSRFSFPRQCTEHGFVTLPPRRLKDRSPPAPRRATCGPAFGGVENWSGPPTLWQQGRLGHVHFDRYWTGALSGNV